MTPSPPPAAQTEPELPARPPVPGETPFLRSGLTVGCGYLLTMLIIVGCAWILITQDWIRQQRTQEVELSSLARAQDEHVAHTFGKTAEAIHSLADMLTYSTQPKDVLMRRLNEETAEGLLQTPQLKLVSIQSRDGTVLLERGSHTDTPFPALPKPSLKYWLENTDARLFIHPPVADAGNNWFIPIERCIRNAKGEFGGSIFVLLAMQDFNAFFRDTQLTPQDRFSLLSLNGRLLLRFPTAHGEALPDFAAILSRAKQAQSQSSNFESSYEFGDEHHIGVIRLVRDLPLVVMVSRPTDISRAGFLAMKQRLVSGVIALGVLLALLSWLLYSDAKRHETARNVLRQLNASLEERVSGRTAELEQSNRELVAFSYSISHDLRAPLRAINGFAHALKEDYGGQFDEQGRDYLDRVYRASVRMGELIDELLALANVSRTPLTIRDVNLSTLAQDIIGDLRINSPGRTVQFSAQADMHIEGDEALLANALSNLLHNAWKFTRARALSIISLSAEEESEFVRFTLADNGIGFDMAHAKRLFQPFQQLHGDQGFGGTGIGLASVRRIIERHGGQIWAESVPDEGARFIFLLPRGAKVFRRRRDETG